MATKKKAGKNGSHKRPRSGKVPAVDNKSRAAGETDDDAPAPPARGRKQDLLPGTEGFAPKRIGELDAQAQEWLQKASEAGEARAAVKACREMADQLLEKHQLDIYVYRDGEEEFLMKRTKGKAKVELTPVKKKKPEKAEDDGVKRGGGRKKRGADGPSLEETAPAE